jgi:hypothetical protein
MLMAKMNISTIGLMAWVMLALTTQPAIGLSEALARKCLQLTLAAYPRPKNYTAGDARTARLRQAFYQNCIAKGGEVKSDDVNN